jgi:hypothetical protein
VIESNSLDSSTQYRIHPSNPAVIQEKRGYGARWRTHSKYFDGDGYTGAEWASAMLHGLTRAETWRRHFVKGQKQEGERA